MAYDTGNPIGSIDARDLSDNAANLDIAVNSNQPRWTDRLGVSRPTWAGMSHYNDIGAYAGGLEITGYNEIFIYSGEYYRAKASTALPYTTTGTWSTDDDFFVPIGDAALRQDIVNSADTTIGHYRNAVNCNQYGGLNAAFVSSDTIGKNIIVTDAQAMTADIDTAGRGLVVEYGGMITTTGYTLTINGPFEAGLYQVFAGSGVVLGLGEYRPEYFGGSADGVTNNFEPFQRMAASLSDNTAIEFDSGNYLISYTGGYDPAKIYGQIACNIKDIKNIKITGNKTVITITNHDITADNGLVVFGYDGVQNLEISGIRFDLSYTGRNSSATYYPFNGAIVGYDTSGTAGSRTGAQLSSGINVHDNVFNIYHPDGCYGEATNSFPGDPNNGFKIYAFTALGDNLGTASANQNFDVQFIGNRFLPTHNAYGMWVWSYNNVIATGNIADAWGNRATDPAGVSISGYIPMFRYHQFYCSGIDVHHNRMTGRPLADRVGGYDGAAVFAHLTTNLTEDLGHGETTCSANTMTLRTLDVGILVGVYGTANIDNNIINGIDVTDRPTAGIDLQPDVNGRAYYNLSGNSTNRLFSGPLVRVNNGAPLKENRRLKVLSITDNKSLNSYGSAISFMNTGSAVTFGVELMYCDNNVFDAVSSEFGSVNTNGAAVSASTSTEASDTYYLRNNIASYFYNLEKCGLATVKSINNDGIGVTASTNYNYLPSYKQTREMKVVTAGTVPRVGTANTDWFSFTAKRIVVASGVVQSTSYGEVAGGSSIAVATPAGESWYIDQILIGKKGI